jgi:hypothetical protein
LSAAIVRSGNLMFEQFGHGKDLSSFTWRASFIASAYHVSHPARDALSST